MRLSMGTWPRRPWRSPFGITTLENPMISLVRGNGLEQSGFTDRLPPHEELQTLSSPAPCGRGRDRPGGSHRSLWWSRRERW